MDGVYSEERVTDLPEQILKRWFMRGTGSQDGLVRVRPQLQKVIQFKKLNLMLDWPMKCQFDFIFCRNVLIYFDRETKALLAKKYAKMLASRSWLFIGHSESLNQLSNEFDLVATTTYKKNI